jgi:hypothetical protein
MKTCVLMIAWIHQSVTDKLEFIRLQLSYLEAADISIRRSGLICLSHLVQGTLTLDNTNSGSFGEVINAEHQLHWINENVQLLRQSGAFEPIFSLLRSSCRWMEDDELISSISI